MPKKLKWKQAVWKALNRFASRHHTQAINFKVFYEEEQECILADTQSNTTSPRSVIRSILQRLCNDGVLKIEPKTRGTYILIDQPVFNASQPSAVDFEAYRAEWLKDVIDGNPSTIELGRRFAHKLITQWFEIDDSSDDIVYCDGAGDGGIDIAYLKRATDEHTWYLVQSKYSTASSRQIFSEAQKMIGTLEGKNQNISSSTQDLLERLNNFRAQASPNDGLIFVFATDRALNENQKEILLNIRDYGKKLLGSIFDVQAVSIETLYQRLQEKPLPLSVPIKIQLFHYGENLSIGYAQLDDLYEFLKAYRDKTGDLEPLYDKNIRRYLGLQAHRKTNQAIKKTLEEKPQNFGFYNNGITLVVKTFRQLLNGYFELTEPYIVNGCQTVGTIWNVLVKKLESGGTGSDQQLEDWKERFAKGIVVLKIVQIDSDEEEELLNDITRYTNLQNRVEEKDFIALTSNFKQWQNQMKRYGVYLELQRGDWEAQKAYQNKHPTSFQFKAHAKVLDLIKVYGAGWLAVPGVALAQNPPFLPGGAIFKKITDASRTVPFGVDDLYAAYLLQIQTEEKPYGPFGRKAAKDKKDSRGSTRFLFYRIVIELLKDVMLEAQIEQTEVNITQSLLKLFRTEKYAALLMQAIQLLDEYFKEDRDNSVYKEDSYLKSRNLSVYLKSDKLGEKLYSKKFNELLNDYKRLMKRQGSNEEKSPSQFILEAISF
jgi:hypothetical protein